MPLRPCRECGQQVSDKAEKCPHCGIKDPGRRPTSTFGVLVILGVIFFGAVAISNNDSNKTATTEKTSSKEIAPPPPACTADWQKCVDNEDLINHFRGVGLAKVKCKDEATDKAKYGTPEWPWFAFGRFLRGNDFPKTGTITIVENAAKFQNAFGAMAHVKVYCDYDLKAEKVTSVSILND